jgi:hypothetical protein
MLDIDLRASLANLLAGGRRASAHVRFADWEAEQMQDPEFRAAAEELEPVYQMERLKLLDKLSSADGEIGQVAGPPHLDLTSRNGSLGDHGSALFCALLLR